MQEVIIYKKSVDSINHCVYTVYIDIYSIYTRLRIKDRQR